MNKAPGQARRLWRSRRWRVSNPVAAFAAIMLFASTQVDSPDRAGWDIAVAAAGTETADMHATASHDGPILELDRPESDAQPPSVATPGAVSGSGKSRDLNLSLFLLRR